MASLTNIIPPSSNQQVSTLLTPTSQPIPLLSSDFAKAYSYAVTSGTLAFYFLRANALVTDPLSTLIQDIVPLAVLQCLFCAICLPIAGSWQSGTGDIQRESGLSIVKKAGTVSATGSSKKRVGPSSAPGRAGRFIGENIAGAPWQSRIQPTILSLVLAIAVPPVPLAVLALVLGAPLYPTTLVPHTFALAVHVSLLGFLPIFYTHGVSSTAWRDVTAAWLPFDEAGVWGGTVGTLVGGWVGAIPIALDWDREWQKWPCTVVWGAAVGWALGRFLTSSFKLGTGVRINLSASSTREEPNPSSQQSTTSEEDKQK